jgi:hypothetical protein
MADLFTQLWEMEIAGIRVTPILLAILVCYGLFLLIQAAMKNKAPQFKRRNLPKEIKEDNDLKQKLIGHYAGHILKLGNETLGHVLSFDTTKEKPVIVKVKGKLFVQEPIPKDIGDEKRIVKVFTFKVCKNNRLSILIAKIFNIGTWYIMADELGLRFQFDEIVINPNVDHDIQSGVLYFGGRAKEVIENIGYKMNRENETEEFLNYIPKMNFLETNLSGIVAKKREEAAIEKEKFKGQSESD